MLRYGYLAICVGVLLTACTSDAIFTPIGDNMANPLTVAVNSTANRAYIVNANDKILYTTGSMHVVDLSTITAPTRVNTVTLDGFGGQVLLDPTNNVVYVPNRISDNDDDTVDALHRINVDEASTSFLSLSSADVDADPFGIGFDVSVAPITQIAVPSRAGLLNIYDISSGTPTRTAQIDLNRTLSSSDTLSSVDAVEAVVIGTQAFVTKADGGLLVVNLSEATSSSANPVDYFVEDLESPRGIATDGVLLYVVNVEIDDDGNETNAVYVLDPATLTADGANTTTTVKDKDTDSLLLRQATVGNDPQEVVLSGTTAYVTNFEDDTVSVIDTTTGTVTATITVGDEPFGMDIYQQVLGTDSHLLVCNHKANTVSIIALTTNGVVATYP